MSDKASDVLQRLVGAIDFGEEQIQNWIDSRANAVAFKVMQADRFFRFERPFESEGHWTGVMETYVGEIADTIISMRSESEHAVATSRRNLPSLLTALEASIAKLEELAKYNGDIHPPNTPWVREQVYSLTGGKCAYCDAQLERGGTEEASFYVEHVVPRAHGGPDNLANYVPACKPCNYSKHAHHVLTFIDRRLGRERQSAPALTVVPKAEDVA